MTIQELHAAIERFAEEGEGCNDRPADEVLLIQRMSQIVAAAALSMSWRSAVSVLSGVLSGVLENEMERREQN